MDLKTALERPFPVNRLHWRVGATNKRDQTGIALAYIDARDVMKRLDDAVGFEFWQCRYPHVGKLIVCEIGLFIPITDPDTGETAGKWMWRSNGAGETAVEGEKGGCSDAFKRAAVMWGIGRYLYSLPNNWVPIKPRGNSWYLPDESIQMLSSRLPRWATPEGYDELQKQRAA